MSDSQHLEVKGLLWAVIALLSKLVQPHSASWIVAGSLASIYIIASHFADHEVQR